MAYSYEAHVIAKLQTALSTDRLSSYLTQTKGDVSKAIQLYVLNVELSECFYTPLQGVEVVVRNAMDRRLSVGFGPAWYDNPTCRFEFAQRQKIDQAKESLRSEAKPITPGRVVSEPSFGFWTGILGRKYENTLWRHHVRQAFPNGPTNLTRQQAHAALDRIRRLRNRIMHHEPVLARNLPEEHALILSVIGWVCSDTQAWVKFHSRVHFAMTTKWPPTVT